MDSNRLFCLIHGSLNETWNDFKFVIPNKTRKRALTLAGRESLTRVCRIWHLYQGSRTKLFQFCFVFLKLLGEANQILKLPMQENEILYSHCFWQSFARKAWPDVVWIIPAAIMISAVGSVCGLLMAFPRYMHPFNHFNHFTKQTPNQPPPTCLDQHCLTELVMNTHASIEIIIEICHWRNIDCDNRFLHPWLVSDYPRSFFFF